MPSKAARRSWSAPVPPAWLPSSLCRSGAAKPRSSSGRAPSAQAGAHDMASFASNSWRPMSKLQGRGMPRSYGRYPHRDDVIAYLDQFALDHHVSTRFNTQLLRVDRDRELWRLHTTSGPMRCRYLLIAPGWDAVPVLPPWPGRETFVPELIHSSEFRTMHPLSGGHRRMIHAQGLQRPEVRRRRAAALDGSEATGHSRGGRQREDLPTLSREGGSLQGCRRLPAGR